MTQQEVAVRARLIVTAAPHLIDAVMEHLPGSMRMRTPSRRMVAEVLAMCGNDVARAVRLRTEWLNTRTADSWRAFVRERTT